MTEEQMKRLLDAQTAQLLGQLTRHFDQRFEALEHKLDARIDSLQRTVDTVVANQERDHQEQAVLNHRYERWIGQLAAHTGTTLRPDLEQ